MMICVDAGHGGSNRGATARTGEREPTIALAWARTLARALRTVGLEVVETRSRDEYVSGGERVRIANNSAADLFVSIHCNASPDPSNRGALTLYADGSAMGEPIARKVQPVLATALGGRSDAVYPDVKPHTNYEDGVYVLHATKMPAILIELGFLTSAADLHLLLSLSVREFTCKVLAEAIRDALLPAEAPTPTEVVLPPAEPETAPPELNVPAVPHRKTVTDALRRRGVAPEAAHEGVAAVEAMLREALSAGVKWGAKELADALADWVRARTGR